ncbi:hypothetical protein [Marinicella sp. W31]|uniref:hypothetical protein n=1 Tax=Marinicella sp. W31 TaxID=3023713 RepID=UPI0037567494
MTKETKPVLGYWGIGIGSIALLMALVHFWAGPFAPSKSFEQTIAEKAVQIKQAAAAKLRGEEAAAKRRSYDIDDVFNVVTAVLGGLGIILAAIGFARKEPSRVVSAAAFLGGGAIAFQFFGLALGVIAAAIVLSAVVASMGGA